MSNNTFSVAVDGLGKRYFVGQAHSNSAHSKFMAHLREFFPHFFNKSSDYFWALRNLSVNVQPGEILGVLGRNGSGKSTFLKILSGVTHPSEGRAVLKGRVGSLLEVGTGFHPDLSGRENVFMSGVLLGLSKREISSRFDEIVDFSGIEPFIDMPVKRYSSGMYVRLAYSVASLLSADILILDEVMAVGDAEFRNKSKNNIERLAREGRTILFVSHNERAVRELCTQGLILENGIDVFQGSAVDAVRKYRQSLHGEDELTEIDSKTHWDISKLHRYRDTGSRVLSWISLHDSDDKPARAFCTGGDLKIRVGLTNQKLATPYISFIIHNEFSEPVATINTTHCQFLASRSDSITIECVVKDLRLGSGTYYIMIDYGFYGGSRSTSIVHECIAKAATFEVNINGFVIGNGIDAFEGAVHKSSWREIH